MKYAIYWTWKEDGQKDSDNVTGRKQLDSFLSDLLSRKELFSEICYCKIYANGEYGIECDLL